MIAPPSGGKQSGIDVTKECLLEAEAAHLIGPDRFKSGSALVRWVKEHPVSLCVQDEFGCFLAKLNDPRSNPCEVEINERMREFWALGPGSIYKSPSGATKGDDSECIKNARLSILGFGVPTEFYNACEDVDIDNGFLPRIALLEEPSLIRLRTDVGKVKFPGKLKDYLLRLGALKETELGWSASAKEVWKAEVERVHSQTDDRKRILWSRTPQKIVKAASVFATCRFTAWVERSDMELAQEFMRRSDHLFKKGMDEAQKKRTMDHAELKHEIIRRLEQELGGIASASEIKKSFKHNTRHKKAIDDALEDMLNSETLARGTVKTGGRDKVAYWVKDK